MVLHRSTALLVVASLALAPLAGAKPAQIAAPKPDRSYEKMVAKVAGMIDSERAYSLAAAQKLQILNVLWEDTGRWEGSSVGPNISDVTIEVEGYRNGKSHRTYLMPVMRHDNFTDKTADVKMDNILIPIGNQLDGGQLELVTLTDLLGNIEQYLSVHDKGKIKGSSLLAKKRDSHVLVSAQHAFLPVPKEGKATFWPVIFNYQSTKKNPAVLTILVTRQGTSVTIIDNNRDTVAGGDSWGQRLYFNSGGKKAPLIAERLTDVKNAGVTANGESAADLSEDSNVLMLIQVPLKFREPPRRDYAAFGGGIANDKPMAPAPAKAAPSDNSGSRSTRAREERSDVDVAVLGHGQTEGPFTELDGLTIQRDARFPVRVTLQFYQATSNGVVSRDNVKAMAAQIRKVYAKGDFVGSLVVPTELDRQRPTAWTGARKTLMATWRDFPGLVERFTTGLMLRPRLGLI
jgi:hypothetical protein